MRRVHWPLSVFLAFALVAAGGCDDDEDGSEAVGDTGGTTDADSDAEADGGSDAEADSGSDAEADSFALSSDDISAGGELPSTSACERDGGGGLSPAIAWDNVPPATESFAVTMHHYPEAANPEVDDPSQYWLMWHVPVATRSIARGNPESIGVEGSDKDGVHTGYTPPCSPGDAVHTYTITVHALSEADTGLGDSDDGSVDWATLMDAIDEITIASDSFDFTN